MTKKNSNHTKHKECPGLRINKGETAVYTKHCVRLGMLPKVSLFNPKEVAERATIYFDYCIEDDMKPTFAGFCLAMGRGRETILDFINGEGDCPDETRDILAKCRQIITAQTEQFMVDSKINPVAGIFLMRNNMGYTNDEVLTVKAIREDIPDRSALIAQAQALIEQKD